MNSSSKSPDPEQPPQALKPCRFCGSNKVEPAPRRGYPVSTCCLSCGATGPQKLTGDEADAAWNAGSERASGASLKVSGIELIAAERLRQLSVEGWTPEHDDTHAEGELAKAAACYATPRGLRQSRLMLHWLWPWHPHWWKSGSERIRELEKAGALIAAEIDRLQRKGNSVVEPNENQITPPLSKDDPALSLPKPGEERDAEERTWKCGCGVVNSVNLATCRVCNRREGQIA